MTNTDKFINHIVHNLFPLNEYSEGEMRNLMAKFKEEAEDLDVSITDDQLKKYIERFDQIKNSPKITKKDLRKYSLAELINLVTASAGAETSTEPEDNTPDVVYNEGRIVIYNGSKEGNCINYGRGESWCITRGSYGNYRYDKDRAYPTFYLAKNENLSSNDRLSFVAIQVRDTSDDSKKYVYTNRKNSPYESNPMSWEQLLGEIPWLRDVPNAKNILKYIPLSSEEKVTQLYAKDAISIRQWNSLPFETKKQYIVVRKDKRNLFDDVSNEKFVSNYLPKYPQLAEFIAVTPGVINSEVLLSNIDKFDKQTQRSILANTRKIPANELGKDNLPFDVKKAITYADKWGDKGLSRLYVTKDKNAIVKLTLGDDIKIGLYTEDADYPNIKLTPRTVKYLLEYPELDKIPLKLLLELVSKGSISREVVDQIIKKGKEDPNSAIIVRDVEGGQIIIDTNSFASYKLEGDTVSRIDFNDPEVQEVLSQETENTNLQQNAFNLVNNKQNIPDTIDKESLFSILNSIPYDSRIITNAGQVLILSPNSPLSIFTVPQSNVSLLTQSRVTYSYNGGNAWRSFNGSSTLSTEEQWAAYFAYLRDTNASYNDAALRSILDYSYGGLEPKVEFIKANPPLDAANRYRPFVITKDGTERPILLNTANYADSLIVGKRGGLIRANITPAIAQRLLGANPLPNPQGGEEPETPAAAAAMGAGQAVAAPLRRRGRPAAGAQIRPVVQQPNAGAGVTISQYFEPLPGGAELQTAFNALPNWARNPFVLVTSSPLDGDRGASRRNNLLRGTGRVIRVLNSTTTQSKMYIIRLNSGTIIASIVIQPGNIHLVMRPNGQFIRIASPSDLATALQQNNLNEELAEAVTRLHMAHDPSIIKEKLKQK
jgi:hypothetical protein